MYLHYALIASCGTNYVWRAAAADSLQQRRTCADYSCYETAAGGAGPVNAGANATSETHCQVTVDTPMCDKRANALLLSAGDATPRQLPVCQDGMATFSVDLSQWHHPELKTLPETRLDLRLSVYAPAGDTLRSVRAVRLDYECLAGNANVQLCHNRERPAHWRRFMWPCRLFDFGRNETGAARALHTAYSCFHMESWSSFRVNFTLLPLGCRLSYKLSMGDADLALALPPAATDEGATVDWVPLVVIDANSHRGVRVRVAQPPAHVRPDVIGLDFALRKRSAGAPVQRRRNLRSRPPADGAKSARGGDGGLEYGAFFTDLPADDYTVTVTVLRTGCARESYGRERCHAVAAGFRLLSGRFVTPWHRRTTFRSVLVHMLGFVLVSSLAALCLCALLYARRRRSMWRRYGRRRETNGGVDATPMRPLAPSAAAECESAPPPPAVLVLYADESDEHASCCELLASWLGRGCGARVFLDRTDLAAGSQHPISWLRSSFDGCTHVLVVYSAGTELALRTGVRPQRAAVAHYGETFRPAMALVLNDIYGGGGITSATTARRRYVFARFGHSPPSCMDALATRAPSLAAGKRSLRAVLDAGDELAWKKALAKLHEFVFSPAPAPPSSGTGTVGGASHLSATSLAAVAAAGGLYLGAKRAARHYAESGGGGVAACEGDHEPAVVEPCFASDAHVHRAEVDIGRVYLAVNGAPGRSATEYSLLPPDDDDDAAGGTEPTPTAAADQYPLVPPDDDDGGGQ